MTEQERNELAAKFGYAINRLNADANNERFSFAAVVDLCVQIAASQLAAKEAEITNLQTQLSRRLETQREMNAIHKGLQDEIERLREGVRELMDHGDRMAKWAIEKDFSRVTSHAHSWIPIWDKWRILLLSPADGDGKPNFDAVYIAFQEAKSAFDKLGQIFGNLPEFTTDEIRICPKCDSDSKPIGIDPKAYTLYRCIRCDHEFTDEEQ